MKDLIEKRITYILIALGLLGFFVFGIVHFKEKVDEQFEIQAYTLLQETTENQKLLFQRRIESQFQLLEFIAQEIVFVEEGNQAEIDAFFNRMEKYSEFYFIGFSDLEGFRYDSRGISKNIKNRRYYQKAINGERSISEPLVSVSDGETLIVSAVPIVKNGVVTGVVSGANKLDDLTISLQSPSFNNTSYAYVATKTGEVIAVIGDGQLEKNDNLFDTWPQQTATERTAFEQMEKDFQTGESGTISYEYADEGRIASYEPFGINDWYIYTVVPESRMMAASHIITGNMLNLIALTLVVFTIVIGYVVIRGKITKNIIEEQLWQTKVSEEKYKIALEQSDTLIFEYRISNNQLEYSPNMIQTLGINSELMTTPEKLVLSGLFPNFASTDFLRMFRRLQAGEMKQAQSMLIRLPNYEHAWYDLYLTVINDANGTPRRAIGKLTNVDAHRAQTAKLIAETQRDPMTGLYNKVATQQLIEAAMTKNKNNHAFMLIDIDNFKAINDAVGHHGGDEAIIEIANILKKICRETDVIGRIGGDEFVVFLDNVKTDETVEDRAQEICESFNRCNLRNSKQSLSASIGIAIAPIHGTNFQELYIAADQAMYQAKKHGKNQYQVSDTGATK